MHVHAHILTLVTCVKFMATHVTLSAGKVNTDYKATRLWPEQSGSYIRAVPQCLHTKIHRTLMWDRLAYNLEVLFLFRMFAGTSWNNSTSVMHLRTASEKKEANSLIINPNKDVWSFKLTAVHQSVAVLKYTFTSILTIIGFGVWTSINIRAASAFITD